MTASTLEPLPGAEASALRVVAEAVPNCAMVRICDDPAHEWFHYGEVSARFDDSGIAHEAAEFIAACKPSAVLRLLAVAEDHARLVGVVAAVEAERDKYLAAFSEQFDQREEYATECKRLWKVEAAVEALADRWTRDGLTHGRLLRAALDTTATKEGS